MLRVAQAERVQRVQLGLPALRVSMVWRVSEARPELLVLRALREQPVVRAAPAQLGQRDLRALQGPLGALVPQAARVRRGQPV